MLLMQEIPSSQNRADFTQPPAPVGNIPIPPSTPSRVPTSAQGIAPPVLPRGDQIDQAKIDQLVALGFPMQQVRHPLRAYVRIW